MDFLLNRRLFLENGGGTEQWDIELYKDPNTGDIQGGAYPCVAGQVWHVEWSPFTNGFIVDFRQRGWECYINQDTPNAKNGGSEDIVIQTTTDYAKVGQRQWSSSNGCNADWIKIRITEP